MAKRKFKKIKIIMPTEEEYYAKRAAIRVDGWFPCESIRRSAIRMKEHPIPYELVKKIFEENELYEVVYR